MKIRLASDIQYDSIVDGEGMRAVLWTQGCPHKCPGCHNPETHDFKGGFLKDVDEVINELKSNLLFEDGLTLSGGDPFMQAEVVSIIAIAVKNMGKNIWAYTGFTFEKLLEMGKENSNIMKLLSNVDVLVDGKFEINLKSMDLYYMGSKNQRVIDVQNSLKNNEIILIDKYNNVKNYSNLRTEKEYIFI